MKQPRNLGIVMDQGADFNLVLGVIGDSGPININGYSFLGEMKSSTDPDAAIVAEFDFQILDQVVHMGQVQWSLPSTEVDAVIISTATPLTNKRQTTPFVFDVKMKDLSGTITRIVQGIIFLSPQATQELFS